MFRRAASTVAGLLFAFASGSASANPGITGYAGKPYFGTADTCETNCHKPPSTPVPTINLTVPMTVQAGSKNEVTLVVDGTRARTSFNAAFSDGVVVTAGSNAQVPFPVETPEEVSAVDPPPSGANGTYKFSFTAPQTNGTITLWVAAMSASGAGTAGDAVAKTKRTITVTGGTNQPADAGASSSSGTAGSTSSSGSSSSGAGASSSSSSSSGATDEGDDPSSSGGGAADRRLPASDTGGCRLAPSFDASWIAVALAVALTAAARGRARRKSTARERS